MFNSGSPWRGARVKWSLDANGNAVGLVGPDGTAASGADGIVSAASVSLADDGWPADQRMRWRSGLGAAPFVMRVGGSVYNGRFDPVFYWGYNLEAANPAEPILQFNIEGDYDTGSSRLMEHNLDYSSADGLVTKRLMGGFVNRATHATDWAYFVDMFRINKDTTQNNFYFIPGRSKNVYFELTEDAGQEVFVLGGNRADNGTTRYHIGPDIRGNRALGLTIAPNGVIGVNKVAPVHAMDVNGEIGIPINTKFLCSGDGGQWIKMHDGGGAFQLATNNTVRLHARYDGQVGIGTTSPNDSAQLEVTSVTRGFLPPRMTTAQRDAIATPPSGLVVYNTTTGKLNVRGASVWEAVTSA